MKHRKYLSGIIFKFVLIFNVFKDKEDVGYVRWNDDYDDDDFATTVTTIKENIITSNNDERNLQE